MKWLAAIFKDPKVVGILLFLLLIGLTWFAGSVIGLSPLHRALFIAAVATITLIIGLMLYLVQRAKAVAAEPSSPAPADHAAAARVGPSEEVEELRIQLQRAMQEMGGQDIPWYMVLGPLGSGKTTLLRYSELDFPLVGIRDVGSRQNCKWWFTHEGVLLDTSGHYVTDNERKEEWLGFIDLLKQARRAQPIKGVVVIESIEDLIKLGEEEIEAHAKKIRNRIDEMMQRLDIVFPVYLVFTKCDLLQGFTEFFGNFGDDARAQIWGCTLPRDNEEPPEVVFESEFRQLYRPLLGQRLSRVGRESDPEYQYKVYTFPLQFAALQDRLSHFTSVLFRPNPYQTRPVFRGFYFTSALQNGASTDFITGRLRRAFGFTPAPDRRAAGEDTEPAGYFITDLFYNVIFRDHVFTRLAPIVEPEAERPRRLPLLIACSAAAVLILIVSLMSYFGNEDLLESVVQASKKVGGSESLSMRLKGYEDLRKELVTLDRREHGWIPLRLRWGMYTGSDINKSARRFYFNRLQQEFVDPSIKAIEERLGQLRGTPTGAEWQEYFDLLTAYLMLSSHREKADKRFLTAQLSKYWGQFLPKDMEKEGRNQLAFYLDQLYDDKEHKSDISSIDRKNSLVERVGCQLSTQPDEVFYSLIKSKGNQVEAFSLVQVLQWSGGRALSGGEVPGVFTKKAWDTQISKAISEEASSTLPADNWVLQEATTSCRSYTADRRQMAKKLQERYFREYAEKWREFLNGVSVLPFGSSLAEAARGLEALVGTTKDSPVVALFKAVDDNTRLEWDLGNGKKSIVDQVAGEFKPIHDLISAPDNQSPRIGGYLSALMTIQNKLQGLATPSDPWGQMKPYISSVVSAAPGNGFSEAKGAIEDLMRSVGPSSLASNIRSHILEPPVRNALGSVLKESGQHLNKVWRDQVYEPWQRTLEGKYPFNPNSPNDAPLPDTADFFRPETGTLAKFLNKELEPVLSKVDGRWKPKAWDGVSVAFSGPFLDALNEAQIITQSLFPDPANIRVSFRIFPYQPERTQLEGWFVSLMRLKIDGDLFPYDMGPANWHNFTWPGRDSGAQIQIRTAKAGGIARDLDPIPGEGPWGWFRLLDKAELDQQSSTKFVVKWRFKIPDSTQSAIIRYDMETERSAHPLKRNFFTRFKCPSQVSP